MTRYENEVFEKLILLVRNEDDTSRKWLVDNDYRELVEWWDAAEGTEKSFKWLLENNYRQLAAVVDAMDGKDQAKVFLLASNNRELAAFVEACEGSAKAVAWLLSYKYHGWVLLAKEIAEKEKKKNSGGFLGGLLNWGNPFR
jgi:hypothetical protein